MLPLEPRPSKVQARPPAEPRAEYPPLPLRTGRPQRIRRGRRRIRRRESHRYCGSHRRHSLRHGSLRYCHHRGNLRRLLRGRRHADKGAQGRGKQGLEKRSCQNNFRQGGFAHFKSLHPTAGCPGRQPHPAIVPAQLESKFYSGSCLGWARNDSSIVNPCDSAASEGSRRFNDEQEVRSSVAWSKPAVVRVPWRLAAR